MKVRGLTCALVAAVFVVIAALPGPVGASSCGPGYEDAVGDGQYDADGDGLVCVNQETGEVTDDQGATPGVVDRNADGIVCVKATPGGTIVRTDNNANNPDNGNCPPGFSPSPLG